MELNEELGKKEGEVAQARDMSYIRADKLYSEEGYVAIIGYLHPLFPVILHHPCHKHLNLERILVARSGFHLIRNQPYGELEHV